jgi:hypothetical protein
MNASVIDALIIAGICASVGWAWRIDKRIDRIDLTLKRLMRDLGLVMVLCLGVGCGHLGNPVVQQPVVTQQPVTNAVGQIELIQVTNVVHLVNTNWLNALEASAAVNAATNPTPSAPFINLALGAAAAGLGWYARIKTRRAAGAQELVDTLITGIERGAQPETKKAVEAEAARRGVLPELHHLVKAL